MSFSLRELAAPVHAPGPAIEWEEVNCLLCGSHRWSPLLEAPDNIATGPGLWFAVVRCEDCGLCFTNPRPNAQSMGQFYPASYWPHRAPRPPYLHGGQLRPIRKWCPPRKDRTVLSWHGEGRLLDFGCGGGLFLQRMHREGWRVTGLDVCPAAVQGIRAQLGLPALVGTLPHPELAPESFDVITMWHSLEHVHNPRQVLQETYFLLAPGGKLLVAVPNIDGLPFRWFGSSWYGLDLPRHLTHFSPLTLRWMLERAGFQVGAVRFVRQSGWMRCSARLACQRSPAPQGRPSWHGWLQAKHVSRLATWYTYCTRQCDCILMTATRAG
jgi:SAM-dependent methyltransferase